MLPFDLSLFQTSYWHYYDSVLAAVSIFAYRGIFFLTAKLQIIIDIEHINRHKKCYIMPFGQFPLCHLANFHYAIWPISIMVFGQFSLWYLANNINAKLR